MPFQERGFLKLHPERNQCLGDPFGVLEGQDMAEIRQWSRTGGGVTVTCFSAFTLGAWSCCSVSKAHLVFPHLWFYRFCVHSTAPQALHPESSYSAIRVQPRHYFIAAFLNLAVQSHLAHSPNALVLGVSPDQELCPPHS